MMGWAKVSERAWTEHRARLQTPGSKESLALGAIEFAARGLLAAKCVLNTNCSDFLFV
jgi:hypothetical protein